MYSNDREAYMFLGGIVENIPVTRNEGFQLKAMFQQFDKMLKEPSYLISETEANSILQILQACDNAIANTPLPVAQHDHASRAIQIFHGLTTSKVKELVPEHKVV